MNMIIKVFSTINCVLGACLIILIYVHMNIAYVFLLA